MKKGLLVVLFVILAAGTAWGSWSYVYTQDVGQRCRGLAVYGPNDFVSGINSSTPQFEIQWYHTAPVAQGAWDCMKSSWTCPICVPPETITYSWNWGIGKEYTVDQFVYHANQDPNRSVLVWDYNCTEVDRLELGETSEYVSACDLDADGNVYVAWYINSRPNQIEVYPPRAAWVVHQAPALTGFEAGAFVCEGMCVNAAGTVIWTTNRSALGSNGWVKRFTGDVITGFTEDLGFGAPAIPGYVRGVDVDEVHDRIFVCSDQNPGDYIYVINATSGLILETIEVDNSATYGGDTFHNAPYDIEYEPTENALYIQHYYGWYVDKWNEYGVAVTMSSFEAIGAEEQVELRWRVESEADNAGFKIYRDGDEIAFVEGQGNSDAPRTYTWVDKDLTAGVTYTYKIANVDLDGKVTTHDFVATATPKASDGVPTTYALAQNYPNPFNADTHIEFTLAKAGHTTLKIYNTTGQLVRTLVDGQMNARMHTVRWNGRNQHNEMVSSGIYFYRLASGTFAETKKMSFLR